jgi:transposase-like protein
MTAFTGQLATSGSQLRPARRQATPVDGLRRHAPGGRIPPPSGAVADSLEEAGDKMFTFTRFPPNQWKSIRTSNAIERLHEEFKRRIKTQTVLPCAETAAMHE